MNESTGKPHSEGQLVLQKLIEKLEPYFSALDYFLNGEISVFEPEVRPLVKYTLGHSGKKLRPMLVFLSGANIETKPRPDIIRAAAIVELVHLATLVHDDILDHADMRHRTETVRAKYGEHAAVLLGDALFAHALKLASDFEGSQVCRIVAESTRQVCSGEIAQTFARGDANLSIENYNRMIDLKTAELFVASAHLGALLGDGRAVTCSAAKTFARHLGIAFQIYDDLSDFLSNESKTGKTLGTDLATGKFTLPFLLWFESLPDERIQVLKPQLIEGNFDPESILLEMKASNVFDRTKERFAQELDLAVLALDGIEGWAGVDELPRLVHYLKEAAFKLLPKTR